MKKIIRTAAAVIGIALIGSACDPQDQLNWWRANNPSQGGKAFVTVESGEQLPSGLQSRDQVNVDLPWAGRSWGDCRNLGGTAVAYRQFNLIQCVDASHAAVGSYLGATAGTPVGQQVTVIRNYDGDTITVNELPENIRVLGYDTPEVNKGEPCAIEARNRLAQLLASGTVTIRSDGDDRDRYGRYLRHVYVNGVPVGQTLINEDLAVARYDGLDGYGRHIHQDAYRAASDGIRC